jgi:hypothetical protein
MLVPGGGVPPRRKSRIGLVVTLVVLVVIACCGGGGGAVWYFNSYAPAKRTSDAKDLIREIGAPTGFGPEGDISEFSVGKRLISLEASYVMQCPKGVCPTNAAAAIVTWATKAGSTEVTNTYLENNCVSSMCYVEVDRDGFKVILYISRGRDYDVAATTPESIVFKVSTKVHM